MQPPYPTTHQSRSLKYPQNPSGGSQGTPGTPPPPPLVQPLLTSLRLRIVNIVGTVCAVLTFLRFLLFILGMLPVPDPVQSEKSTSPEEEGLPDVENRFVVPTLVFYLNAIADDLENGTITWIFLTGSCGFWIALLIRREAG